MHDEVSSASLAALPHSPDQPLPPTPIQHCSLSCLVLAAAACGHSSGCCWLGVQADVEQDSRQLFHPFLLMVLWIKIEAAAVGHAFAHECMR